MRNGLTVLAERAASPACASVCCSPTDCPSSTPDPRSQRTSRRDDKQPFYLRSFALVELVRRYSNLAHGVAVGKAATTITLWTTQLIRGAAA